MSKLCLTLTEKTIKDCLAVIESNRDYIDTLELRVDFLDKPEQEKLSDYLTDIPTILTFRKEVDGGLFSVAEDYRLRVLMEGIKSGNFSYVDLEADLDVPELDNAAKKYNLTIIRSFHNFSGVPKDLGKTLLSVKRNDSEIPKAAVMINNTAELLEFYKEALSIKDDEKIILGMGSFGFNTRILAEKIGSYLTFSSKEGESAAPGHTTPKQLNTIYNFRKITKETDIMGIIGNPVMHTKSPEIHNNGYKTLGLNAVYIPFETDNLNLFLKLAELLEIKGFSVTVPFKNDIIPFLDNITESVKIIGACNTVTRIDEKWIGENTDYIGFINPLLKAFGSLVNKKITVIGAGGAAKSSLFALLKEGAKVLLLNRTLETAKKLADQFGVEYAELNPNATDIIKKYSDVIVQTTNVGMHPLEHLDPFEFFSYSGSEFLYDIIYTPEVTKFLKKGLDSNCNTLNGWQMLLEQGYRQFKLFTGFDYPAN